jgi:hypothetical protein
MEDKTTLMVPKQFARFLRSEFDGKNDIERLQNWRLSASIEAGMLSKDDVRDACVEALMDVR